MAPAKKSQGSAETPKSGSVPPAFEPLAVFFDKKVRNLEKRKAKLETYRALQKEGKLTDAGQIKAVAKYEECVASLTFASSITQEILPVLLEINAGLEKAAIEKEKDKDKLTKSILRTVLDTQDLYEQLGDESVRSDFAAGAKNATPLSEEQLQTIDKLYMVSKPSRTKPDGTFKQKSEYKKTLEDSVTSWNRLINKNGAIDGSDLKYEEMRSLFQSVSACDYFDEAQPVAEEPPVESPPEQPEPPAPEVQPESFSVEPEVTFESKRVASDILGSLQGRAVNFVQEEVPPNVESLNIIGSSSEATVVFNGGFQESAPSNLSTGLTHASLENENIQQFGHFNGNAFANETAVANEINNNFPITVNNVSESRGSFPPMESWADDAPEPFDPSLNSGCGDSMFVEVRRGGSGSNQAPRYRGGGGIGYGRGGGGSYRGDFQRGGGNRGGNRNYDGRGFGRPYRGGDFREDSQGGGNFYNRGGGGQGFMTKEFSSRGGRGGKLMRGGGFDRPGMNNTATAGGRS